MAANEVAENFTYFNNPKFREWGAYSKPTWDDEKPQEPILGYA